MTAREQADQVALRLGAVDWGPNFQHSASRVRLMREYLRRSALWARELGVLDKWPFFDIAAEFDPEVGRDTEFADAVLEGMRGRGLTYPHTQFCRYMLAFAGSVPPHPDLPDPYEPLLQVYERGGLFDMEHGIILVDHTLQVLVWPMERYLKPGLRYDISEQALAEMDARANG
ncbi:hypothetical protein [Catellatospora tritici]|uniref:hypothetical protein n=1 Tax=Catellatospora tritici TaxID=2851566 RepID=UPI001C2D8491|nr:hypothetical protein [Catellatospora tritici]MBV1852438.1 hypothetical protein [Catellatospora tritici]